MTGHQLLGSRIAEVRRLLGPLPSSAEAMSRFRSPSLEGASEEAALTFTDSDAAYGEALLRAMPPGEVPDRRAFARALDTLMRHGEPALKRLFAADNAEEAGLDGDDIASLEAIVIANGTRPSFLLREGEVDRDHPFLGDWKTDIDACREPVKALAACIGRIEPKVGSASRYIGTGTLVCLDPLTVLTNYHVVAMAQRRFGVGMHASGNKRIVDEELFIEFGGESESSQTNRFRVVEVRLPERHGQGFEGLDAAALRIEPLESSGNLPASVPILSLDPRYEMGASPTLCTIGFPGPPDQYSAPASKIDWSFVISTLFGSRFGYKRLAPGLLAGGRGTVKEDKLQLALSHDATTFGGASGSLVFAWMERSQPAFALHFAGRTGERNFAVSLSAAAEALERIGIPFACGVSDRRGAAA